MSLVVYGPDDLWPRHQKAFWNEALSAAREHGWTYAYLGADHKSGDLVCPAGEHVLTVDKTSVGGAHFASRATKIITSRCPHGTGGGPAGKVKERIETAARLLSSAEELIVAARGDLDLIQTRATGDKRLAEIDELRLRLDTADLTLAEVESMEMAALKDAVADAPAPAVVGIALEEADENVAKASRMLGMVRKHHSLKELVRRAVTARTEIETLQASLEQILHENG